MKSNWRGDPEGEHAAALAAAVRMLTRRDHMSEELRTKLASRGFSAQAISAVMKRLFELNYLDDQRVAQTLADAAVREKGIFGARLHIELRRRGVPREMAGEISDAASHAHDETHLLRAVLARKFPRFDAAGSTDAELRRVVGYLQRRGFSLSTIMQVVKGRVDYY